MFHHANLPPPRTHSGIESAVCFGISSSRVSIMTRASSAVCLAAVLVALTPLRAPAHGNDELIIEALTEELERNPDADLFIRRGELFRHHQEWAKAEADYLAAARLEPKLVVVDFFRARALLESGAAEKALGFVERYIANVPDEAEGRFLRGDVLAALGKHDEGATEYAEGIRRASSPRPEHYLRRARFLASAPAANPARVLAALDEGIARIGPVISLVVYAITLELERTNYEAALARIDAAMERAPRRELWLVRRGDVLVKCGRTAEAIASYQAALAEIEELPARHRDTVPVEKLARDARTSLDQLSANQSR
jgi:tetratricopeptide (TPR) repeat protein